MSLKSYKGQDIPLESWIIELEDIEKETGKLLNIRMKNESDNLKSNKYFFEANTILYGKLRPYLQKIVKAEKSGYCSTEIIPISFTNHNLKEFIYFMLFSNYLFDLVNSETYGVNLPRVSPALLKSLPVPVPPEKEQQRIVGKLNQIDSVLKQFV